MGIFDLFKKKKPKSLMDELEDISPVAAKYMKMQQILWRDNSSGCSTDEMPNGIGEFGLR